MGLMTRLLVRVAKIAAAVVLVLAATAAALYWAVGIRVRLDGSGTPRLVREVPPTEIAEAVESHRASQSASGADAHSPQPAVAAAAAKAVEPSRAPAAIPSRPAYWTAFRGPLRDGTYRERPILTSW